MVQDTFDSPTWGRLTFFPSKTDKWNDTCKHCLLFHSEAECEQVRCVASERDDRRNGYFAIHQMPTTKTTQIKRT